MSIHAVCSGCQKRYQVAESAAGKTIRCKHCGANFKIPMAELEDDGSLFAQSLDEAAAGGDLEDEASSQIYVTPKATRSAPQRVKGSNSTHTGRRSPKAGSSRMMKWIAVALGGAGTLVLLCCGGVYYLFSLTNPPPASPQASEPFPMETVKIPSFPELGAPQVVPETEVSVYQVDLGPANPGNAQPAARMQLRVYLPAGEHRAGSLGCVLIGPAGTNLMTGNELVGADRRTFRVDG